MDLKYEGDIYIELNKEDICELIQARKLFGKCVGVYNKRETFVHIYPSNEKFCCSGGVGEGFDKNSFQGFILKEPREETQLAFPWGEETTQKDYSTIEITISNPVLNELLKKGKSSMGMARGIASGHLLDRLNLWISLD